VFSLIGHPITLDMECSFLSHSQAQHFFLHLTSPPLTHIPTTETAHALRILRPQPRGSDCPNSPGLWARTFTYIVRTNRLRANAGIGGRGLACPESGSSLRIFCSGPHGMTVQFLYFRTRSDDIGQHSEPAASPQKKCTNACRG